MGEVVRVPLIGRSVRGRRDRPYVGPDAAMPAIAAFRASPAAATASVAAARGDTAASAAAPSDGATSPVRPVILVHGAWGLDSAICDLADALAAGGAVVLVPDLAGGRLPVDRDAAAALLAGLEPEDAIRALAASVDALRADPALQGGDDARDSTAAGVDVAGFGAGAPLAAFLAVVRPEITRLVLAGGDPPDLPIAAWDGLEADALVLLGADQDGGPAAAWAATLAGLGPHARIETLPDDVVADDPGEPMVAERLRRFFAGEPAGG